MSDDEEWFDRHALRRASETPSTAFDALMQYAQQEHRLRVELRALREELRITHKILNSLGLRRVD